MSGISGENLKFQLIGGGIFNVNISKDDTYDDYITKVAAKALEASGKTGEVKTTAEGRRIDETNYDFNELKETAVIRVIIAGKKS